jgi:purine-binding chemotaxis protein CheW
MTPSAYWTERNAFGPIHSEYMAIETYVIFELAGTTYALPSREVQHIEMLDHVTPVPNTLPSVEGVVFSRGQVIPAMNLRVRFGFPRQAHTMRTRTIIVQVHQRTVALIVDAAREFRAIPENLIRPIEETISGMNGNYLRGVASLNDRLVLLLNLEAVLNLNDVSQVADAASMVASANQSSSPETAVDRAEAAHAHP